MANPYFSLSESVYDVTERFPKLLDVLVNNGFENMGNEKLRSTVGRSVSIEAALKSKGFDLQTFEKRMVDVIEAGIISYGEGLTDRRNDPALADIKLSGILPCPIRIQLLDHLDSWIDTQEKTLSYELPAASMGLDWLKEQICNSKEESELSDVYLSTGFSVFFEKSVMGRYFEKGTFTDLTGFEKLNPVFDNEKIDLKDPKKQYSIISVVPAVFMVNTELLKGRECPTSWADLLKPEFENSVALPLKDLDLFKALLLAIYKEHGEEGVAKLGKSLMTSIHPAQMIKLGAKKQEAQVPLVTVMPHFFSHMAKSNSPVKRVWPKEGAIISPVFLVTKKDSAEKLQPLVDHFCSKEMGELFSAQGKFPSTHPQVDNGLLPEENFYWIGWDFIYGYDMEELMKRLEKIFYQKEVGAQ